MEAFGYSGGMSTYTGYSRKTQRIVLAGCIPARATVFGACVRCVAGRVMPAIWSGDISAAGDTVTLHDMIQHSSSVSGSNSHISELSSCTGIRNRAAKRHMTTAMHRIMIAKVRIVFDSFNGYTCTFVRIENPEPPYGLGRGLHSA